MVIFGNVPLKLQTEYTELVFSPGGYVHKELNGEFDAQRYSEIMKLVNNVSVRLTEHYQTNPNDPNFEKYFNLAKMKAASHHVLLELKDTKKKPGITEKFCNGYLTIFEGDVYFVTADHCIEDTKAEQSFRRNKQMDQAVRYIAPFEYQRWMVQSPEQLPPLTTAKTTAALSGQIVASISERPDGKGGVVEHIVFSVAMHLSEKYRIALYGQDADQEFPAIKGATIMLRPPEDGRVTRREASTDPKKPGKVLSIVASGSSGSMVAVPAADFVTGALSTVSVIEDSCTKVCYATSSVGNPKTLQDLIREDQQARAKKILEELKIPK